MKIAVTATGPTLDDNIESRFGRCPYFILVEPDTLAFEALPNPNIALGGGAGIQSAGLMAEKGVKAVLTGNCGPNAFQTFGAAGVEVITGVSGTVRAAVEQFKAGALRKAAAPNAQSGCGGGAGTGRGMGMGGGGGMGRGMGRGMGMGGGGGRGRGMGMGGRLSPSRPISDPQVAAPAITPGADGAAAAGDVPAQAELAVLKQTADSLRQELDRIEKRIATMAKK